MQAANIDPASCHRTSQR